MPSASDAQSMLRAVINCANCQLRCRVHVYYWAQKGGRVEVETNVRMKEQTATGHMAQRNPPLRGGDVSAEMTSLAQRGEAVARRTDALSPRTHVIALSHLFVFFRGRLASDNRRDLKAAPLCVVDKQILVWTPKLTSQQANSAGAEGLMKVLSG